MIFTPFVGYKFNLNSLYLLQETLKCPLKKDKKQGLLEFIISLAKRLDRVSLKKFFIAIKEDGHPHAGNLMLMALYTGMRAGELFKLKWSDVDFEKEFILIRGPKGGQDQIIPLNQQARQVLQNHIRIDSDYVFPGKGGNQRTTIQKPVNEIKERAGLPRSIRPLHSLRHTFATVAYNSGEIDLFTLQRLTTHKSPKMLQRYTHLGDKRFKEGSASAGEAMQKRLQENLKKSKVNVVSFKK